MNQVAKTFVVLVLAIVPASRLSADDASIAAALAEKGVKTKVERDGTVSEIYFADKAKLTLDDYRLIGQLHGLKRANMSANDLPLNDETAAVLGELDRLEHFFSNGAEITDDGLKAFQGWKSLRHFGFDHWGWKVAKRGTLGPGLAHLAVLPNLESVRFGGCRIDNRATTALAQIKSLQSIDLQHTFAVTDDGIPALKDLPKLRVIKLSPQFSPRITDVSLRHLGGIGTLEEITVTETWLTYDTGFVHLKNLPALRMLTLEKVIASEDDITRLKADHPSTEVKWTAPDEATAEKTKVAFRRHWEQRGKK